MAQWFRLADLEPAEIRAMTEALARHGTWLDVTRVTFDRMFRGNRTAVHDGPDLQYAAPSMRGNWKTFDLALGWSAEDRQSAVEPLAEVRRLGDSGGSQQRRHRVPRCLRRGRAMVGAATP